MPADPPSYKVTATPSHSPIFPFLLHKTRKKKTKVPIYLPYLLTNPRNLIESKMGCNCGSNTCACNGPNNCTCTSGSCNCSGCGVRHPIPPLSSTLSPITPATNLAFHRNNNPHQTTYPPPFNAAEEGIYIPFTIFCNGERNPWSRLLASCSWEPSKKKEKSTALIY